MGNIIKVGMADLMYVKLLTDSQHLDLDPVLA